MGFRITTNMMMNSYRYNLQNSTNKLADARDKVLTQRNFNSYAEDPAAATLAFRLRRNYCTTSNQLSSTKDTYGKFNTAWHNLQGIIKDLGNANSKVASIRGTNGTAGESRSALARLLRETGNSVIQAMNQKLGDHFVFAGNDALNAPFEWDETGEVLTYRGINVNAGAVEKPIAAEPGWMDTLKAAIDNPATDPADKENYQGWYDYYTHKTDVKPADPADAEDVLKNIGGAAPAAGTTDEGWYNYYLRKADAPPTADEPAWGDKDKYGVPENMDETSTDPVEQGWVKYYKDQKDLKMLEEMKDEKMYLDMGMGMAEHAPNQPVNGTYSKRPPDLPPPNPSTHPLLLLCPGLPLY